MTSRTEYQRNYMRDWRAKNPTSRVGKLEAVLAHLEDEARRFAAMYPQGSDGRNTFLIFADKIAATHPQENISGASYDRDGRFGG